jgi:hypothetical protein
MHKKIPIRSRACHLTPFPIETPVPSTIAGTQRILPGKRCGQAAQENRALIMPAARMNGERFSAEK